MNRETMHDLSDLMPVLRPVPERDGLSLLAEAIVRRAAIDYDAALRMRALHPGNPRWAMLCRENETFFRSDWCALLSAVDGEELLRRLRDYAARPGSVPLSRIGGDPLPWE